MTPDGQRQHHRRTGVLVAATDRTDPYNQVCAELLNSEAEPLVTTAMVIAETAYLLDRELGSQVGPQA